MNKAVDFVFHNLPSLPICALLVWAIFTFLFLWNCNRGEGKPMPPEAYVRVFEGEWRLIIMNRYAIDWSRTCIAKMESQQPPPNTLSDETYYATTIVNTCSGNSTGWCFIESLPGELLVRIIRLLPCRQQVRIERVCKRWRHLTYTRVWNNVHHIGETCMWDEEYPLPTTVQAFETLLRESYMRLPALFSRIGPHLTSIDLLLDESGILRAQLPYCPNLQHISIRTNEPETVDYIRTAYGKQLKSLRLRYGLYETERDANDNTLDKQEAIVSALNAAFSEFYSLERLKISEVTYSVINKLEFSPTGLQHLRRLILYQGGHKPWAEADMLDSQRLARLSSLPSLRSLLLFSGGPLASFSFLRKFPRLEHLFAAVNPFNAGSLVEALPHLSGMRALELYVEEARSLSRAENAAMAESLFSAVVTHLPLLEHMGLCDAHLDEESPRWLAHCLWQMNEHGLRSLSLNTFSIRDIDEGAVKEWDWLEQMDQLEHLSVWAVNPPVDVLCNVIRNCKNLRSLSCAFDKFTPEQRVELKEAAAAPPSPNWHYGWGGQLSTKSSPPLHSSVPPAPTKSTDEETVREITLERWDGSKLQLNSFNTPKSHYSDRYIVGPERGYTCRVKKRLLKFF